LQRSQNSKNSELKNSTEFLHSQLMLRASKLINERSPYNRESPSTSPAKCRFSYRRPHNIASDSSFLSFAPSLQMFFQMRKGFAPFAPKILFADETKRDTRRIARGERLVAFFFLPSCERLNSRARIPDFSRVSGWTKRRRKFYASRTFIHLRVHVRVCMYYACDEIE